MFDAVPGQSGPRRYRFIRAATARLLSLVGGDEPFAFRFPDGSETVLGGDADPALKLSITDWRTVRRICLNPEMALGEAYMDGRAIPVGGTIYDVLERLMATASFERVARASPVRTAFGHGLKRLRQFNPRALARRHVAHHYDFGLDVYRLMLDEDFQYSCAYFPTGSETIDEAQRAKKAHIASKLRLDRPGLRVLDIGCGWGGLALTLARDYGADVTGITLSHDQLAVARARAAEAGLADRVRFEMLDYRNVPFSFDRIVSVGMFEHVGINHYDAFFATVNRCLEPDGVALIHAIGRSHGPGITNPWLLRYIFPGGYAPALSELMPPVERSGLLTTDIEILRLHYAFTLRHWRERLERNRDAVIALQDERFLRMFEFYLSGSELSFRKLGFMVWQIQLARQQTAVPLTRSYIT